MNIQDYRLSNGIMIPAIGFGTWQSANGPTTVKAVETALQNGYRHIDTAAAYDNEASVGEGIRNSGKAREDVFLTSKVWNADRGYEKTLKAFDRSVRKLGVDHLDLYLIHWPANAVKFPDWQKINAETWRALETLYRDGRVKAIGLSNFVNVHLEALSMTAEIPPMVNQIEFHPGQLQAAVVKRSQDMGMVVEAWSPLGTGKMLENAQLIQLALKYGISVAQLCIRWALQHGVLPLPKSVTPERIIQNIDVDGFEIAAEDMQAIDRLPYIGGSGLDPESVTF